MGWKRPEIRTSMEEEESIASTAGLYEIEELISELQEDNPFGKVCGLEYVDKSAEAEEMILYKIALLNSP